MAPECNHHKLLRGPSSGNSVAASLLRPHGSQKSNHGRLAVLRTSLHGAHADLKLDHSNSNHPSIRFGNALTIYSRLLLPSGANALEKALICVNFVKHRSYFDCDTMCDILCIHQQAVGLVRLDWLHNAARTDLHSLVPSRKPTIPFKHRQNSSGHSIF